MRKTFSIAGRSIGEGFPCFIIAEAGVNHNGDLDLAMRMIETAKTAGADAIKFQSFITEELVTNRAEKAEYQKRNTKDAGSQVEMLKRLELSWEDHLALQKKAADCGILFLSTPFEDQSLERLERLGLPAYKISSTDLTNLPFIEAVASKGKPVILSTGMSYMEEVSEAQAILERYLGKRYVLLHCTSNYPAQKEELNLRVMTTLQNQFDCLVGYSDHSAGIGASPYAVAMGACVIEKHFTLDRSLPGPDHLASLVPSELRELVGAVRDVETMLGTAEKKPTASESQVRLVVQKSLVAAHDIPEGTVLRREDLRAKRPAAGGLSPREINRLIGRTTQRALVKDEPLGEEIVAPKGAHS